MSPRFGQARWSKQLKGVVCVRKAFSTSEVLSKPTVDSIAALRNIIDDPDGPQKLIPISPRGRTNSPYAKADHNPIAQGRRNPELRKMMELQSRERPAPLSTSEEFLQVVKDQALEKYQTRRWKAGDVYAPKDIGSAEMRNNMRWSPPKVDHFDMLAINPLKEYKNFAIMSEYMTDMGRIKHSRDTGLRPVNQRKMAKALRRAIGLGLMPSVHAHPEILDAASRRRRTTDTRYTG